MGLAAATGFGRWKGNFWAAMGMACILMLLYGILYRFMSGDDSLYLFGIPVIPGSNREETTQEETTGSDAPAETSRALFQAVDEMLG